MVTRSCRFCEATDGLRDYLIGVCCLLHTPAAQHGRPEPPVIPPELQARFAWPLGSQATSAREDKNRRLGKTTSQEVRRRLRS